jgi:hypothetical protein
LRFVKWLTAPRDDCQCRRMSTTSAEAASEPEAVPSPAP